jgi:subtilisin-like proprotein convertase family protein
MDEKASRTPAEKKISSQILYAFKVRAGQPLTNEVTTLKTSVEKDADGRIKVDMDAIVTAKLLNELKTYGSEIIFSSEKFGSVVANIPLDKVVEIAALDAIKHINYWIAPVHGSNLNAHLDNYKTINAGDFDRIKTPEKKTDEAFFSNNNSNDFATRARNVREQIGSALKNKQMGYGGKGFFSGSVTSQGDVTHKADIARTLFGTNGSGVKIGVISDSYNSSGAAAIDVINGNLPGPGNPNGFTTPVTVLSDVSGSDEGRAMLQIVHDLAPGARLYFATAFISEASFAQQILDLRAAGCDIIVDDVSYYDEGVFQDGIVAQAVNSVTTSGALYFSSAANSGNKNDGTSGVWEGDFTDGGSLALFPGGTIHDFNAGTLFNTITADGGPVVLKWSDPLGSSANDYDLFITDSTGTSILTASTDIQDGNDNPFEGVFANVSTGMRVYILKKTDALPRALHLNTNGAQLNFNTSGVMYGHNAAASAYSVAATPAAAPINIPGSPTGPYPGVFNSTNKVEVFSSDGPRRIFFNPNGTEITPGNVLFVTNGGVLLQKPDITAADGVITTLPSGSGLNPFFGTSAAAPHAGAIAALIKSKLPLLTPAQIKTAIISSAIDIEDPGADRDAGAGIIMAYEALTAAGATLCNLPTITAPTVTQPSCASFIGTGTIVVNAGSSGTIEYSLNGSPYQTSNTFSGLPPGTYNITAKIDGQDAGCIVTYSGNPVTIIPANTAISSSSYIGPSVAIPDGNANGVDIPLTIGGLGLLSNLKLSFDGSGACSSAVGSTTAGITHSWVGDLVVTLISPSGTSVVVMNRPGGTGNSGNNFCNTVLDDAASNSIQNIAIGGAPWSGSFKPANPLSAFAGEDPNGTWILHVADEVTIDVGTVNRFSLIINGQAACPGQTTLLTSQVSGNIDVCAGPPSSSPNLQHFTVSGSLLAGPVAAFAPANFEVSTDPVTGFGPNVVLISNAGTLPTTAIYVRTAANAPAGSLSGYVRVQSPPLIIGVINVLVKARVTGVAAISAPTVTQIVCGSNDGSIVVNATGDGVLEYSIDGGATWSASNTFNNLGCWHL